MWFFFVLRLPTWWTSKNMKFSRRFPLRWKPSLGILHVTSSNLFMRFREEKVTELTRKSLFTRGTFTTQQRRFYVTKSWKLPVRLLLPRANHEEQNRFSLVGIDTNPVYCYLLFYASNITLITLSKAEPSTGFISSVSYPEIGTQGEGAGKRENKLILITLKSGCRSVGMLGKSEMEFCCERPRGILMKVNLVPACAKLKSLRRQLEQI